MNDNPIGVLDSGVGGLSVWKEITKELPYESTVYIADSKNCPYGNKSSQQIYHLAQKLVQFLLDKQCKLIVLACNTISVSCLDKLRNDFPKIPIIGTVPVVKTANKQSRSKKIGILSTIRTAESSYQKELIKRFTLDCEVVNIGTDKLVPFVEKGSHFTKASRDREVDNVLREVLKPFQKAGIDTLALGCSHFSFLRDQIQEVLGSNVLILDSGAAIARQARRVLTNNNLLSLQNKSRHNLYTTGSIAQFAIIARKLMPSVRRLLVQGVSL